MSADPIQTTDLPTRLRETFKAWGLRNLGDEAADEIERLRHDNARLVEIATGECNKA